MVGHLRRRVGLLWAAPLLLLDQGSKAWALAALADGGTRPLLPPFAQFTLVENRGITFGLLPGWGSLFTLLALAVALWLWRHYPRLSGRPARLGAALVLGGALGNALDRLRHGFVVDFVHLEWPGLAANVSNFADHALVLGALLLALATLRPAAKSANP